MTSETPWSAWLRLALSTGIAPRDFWRLSLREWRALAGPGAQLTRTEFDALQARFPDRST